jgi:hypothetical protein
MDVKEAEERTKIRARYLRALEAEDWEALPAPAYVRGFLRTYGSILGLDGAALADEYRRRYEEPPGGAAGSASEPLLREPRRAPGTRPPSRGPLIAAIAGGIVVLLLVLWALGGGGGDDSGNGKGGKNAAKLVKKKDGGGKKGGKGGSGLVPINVVVEPLDTVQVCLVGDGDALVPTQVLGAGSKQQFGDKKSYRLDLEGGGVVQLTAGNESKKLKASGNASFEADSKGIRQIDYAGPDCP